MYFSAFHNLILLDAFCCCFIFRLFSMFDETGVSNSFTSCLSVWLLTNAHRTCFSTPEKINDDEFEFILGVSLLRCLRFSYICSRFIHETEHYWVKLTDSSVCVLSMLTPRLEPTTPVSPLVTIWSFSDLRYWRCSWHRDNHAIAVSSPFRVASQCDFCDHS